MRIQRITRVLAAMLALLMLTAAVSSCSGPNLRGISGEELNEYIAMETENFQVTGGMFAYYFFDMGYLYVQDISQEELDERGFDENKKLFEQKYDADRTWYDYICEFVISEVENALLWCEAALAAGITLTNSDYAYVNDQMSGLRMQALLTAETDYETYLDNTYFGYVCEEDVERVLLIEALAAKYGAHLDKQIKERMTQERVDAYLTTVEGERDMTLTRDLGHVFASYGQFDEDQTYEICMTAKRQLEEGGKTMEALEKVWKEHSADANMVYENVGHGEMLKELEDWLYAEGRQVGDVGIVTSSQGCHMLFYCAEGDPVYIANAKHDLYGIIRGEILEEERAKIHIKVRKNVCNALDV